MEYEDEKIIALKKQMRNLTDTNIRESGIYIQDQYIKFNQIFIFDEISIYLPEDFIDIPEMVKTMKYPSENRPAVIKTSLDTSVNFSFNMLEKINSEQVKELAGQLKSTINKMNPSFTFYEEWEGETLQDNKIRMFDFKSYGLDEQIYNMMCLIPLKNGTLHGIFNCLDRDSEDWKEVAWKVFLTTKEQKKEV